MENAKKLLKKIKTIDLCSMLSTVLFFAFIIFFALVIVFFGLWTDWGFDKDKMSGSQVEQQKLVLLVVFILSFVFLGIAVIMNIYASILLISKDWEDEEINKKKKLIFILNILQITLSIPLDVYVKKMNKKVIANIKALRAKQEQSYNTNNNVNHSTIISTTYVTNPEPVTTEKVVTTTTTTTTSIPVNEPFFYDNVWMYFDGSYFWEADQNNEWVLSQKHPQHL